MYKRIEDIEIVIKAAQQEPIIILKHSSTCPVSADAKNEVDAFIAESKKPVYLVIVQEERAISNELADKLHVTHQSPQLLVLYKDTVSVLNHYEITKERIMSLMDT